MQKNLLYLQYDIPPDHGVEFPVQMRHDVQEKLLLYDAEKKSIYELSLHKKKVDLYEIKYVTGCVQIIFTGTHLCKQSSKMYCGTCVDLATYNRIRIQLGALNSKDKLFKYLPATCAST